LWDLRVIKITELVSTYCEGLGVLKADKSQLQRKGITPHVEVTPTLSDISKGRDDILEAAQNYLKRELSKM
jgi:C-terminal processing protease CtpA/Prc